MKKNNLFLAIFLFASLLNAQNVLSWKIYTDMKNVSAVSSYNEFYFASTTGGMFLYNTSDQSYTTLTKVDGLSSHNLTSMTIDSNGKIWITTQEGIINVYDFTNGGEIRKILDIYTSDKNQKQINDVITKNNKIYISSSFGISILDEDNESFDETIVRFGDLNSESKVNSTFVNDKIYIALDAGVAIQKEGAQNLSAPSSWTSYPVSEFTGSSAINCVIHFNNTTYAGGDKGLYYLSTDGWKKHSFENNNIVDLKIHDNTLFTALDHSIYKFGDSGPERIFINNALTIHNISFDNSGKILAATNKGLWVIDGVENTVLIPDGPEANTFNSLTIDTEHNLWVGSGQDVTGAGVFKFNGTSWENFNTGNTPEFKTNAFHEVSAAADSSVYLMNWGHGYTKYKNGVFETVDNTNSPLMGITEDENFVVITGVQFDSHGNMWVLNLRPANRKHLSVLTTDGTWYQYSMDSPYLGTSVQVEHLVIDAFDTKWFIATSGASGIYYYNENGTFENTGDDIMGRLNADDGLRSNTVTSDAVDQRGDLWVGNTAGINTISILSEQSYRINQTGVPLWGLSVNAIATDAINRKWVGTNQGLFLMTSDGIQALEQFQSTNSPLLSDDIKSIAIDQESGMVYVGTDYGLMVLETSAKKPVSSYEDLIIYPNPFYVGDSYSGQLTIDGLVTNSSIKILTVEGKLIKEYSTAGRQTNWDGRDEDGKFVSSGIYIIVAYDEDVNNVTTGKVAVFNK